MYYYVCVIYYWYMKKCTYFLITLHLHSSTSQFTLVNSSSRQDSWQLENKQLGDGRETA